MPSVGMLLCKDHSNDTPTTVASALLPASEEPPLKSRRAASRAVKAAKRSAVPMEAEQIPMSKKQARRLHTEFASGSSEANTEKPHSLQKSAQFADLTNSPPVQSRRPKRAAAVKAPVVDLSDSASDEESTSASEFEPAADDIDAEDNDNVSEANACAGEPSDLDLDDRDVGDTSPYTGELLSFWRGTPIDSAQVTVFDYPPPSIPCCKVPKLKLFHELTDAERDVFLEPDKIKPSCTYCRAESKKPDRKDYVGILRLYEHFYNDGDFHACTWPGCTSTFSCFQALLWHYGCCHDHRFAIYKCDKCKYVANSPDAIAVHVKRPHPASEEVAKATRSLNSRRRLAVWKNPKFCDKCKKWYPENEWIKDEIHHSTEYLEYDNTLPVQGLQIPCLRDDTCPFDACDEPYRDFIGWYLHCNAKHSEYILAAGNAVPLALTTEERERVPMFRCTNCFMCVPIAQVYRHHTRCAAWMLPETVGPLMRQRATVYNLEPGMLKLVYGQSVMKERRFAGLIHKVIASAPDPQRFESSLRAIRSDPFLLCFAKRNKDAPASHVLYTVAKVRRNNVPEIGEWAKDLIVYVGSTTAIEQRVAAHRRDTLTKWHDMGLTLQADEDLYLMRMCITVDKQTSIASFNEPDLRRLEQVLIDALGMGTTYNVARVFSPENMLNDVTYRNHIAPRLWQLALVLLESTHARLKMTSFSADNKNVWKIPITRRELNNIVRQATDLDTRVDQACSPIPAPRIFSPDLHEALTLYRDELRLTEEQLFDRLRARRHSASTSRHTEGLDSDEPQKRACKSTPPSIPDSRSAMSPDLFADSHPDEAEERARDDQDFYDFKDVTTTSNGPDYNALDASVVRTTTTRHPERSDLDKPHMPAGESVQSGGPRLSSPDPLGNSPSSVVSANKTVPITDASGSVPLPVTENRNMRIPSYGNRSTQHVDLARTPVDLTQDASSEGSHDEPSQDLPDESSELSDEEPPREILDDPSEASLDEPSPTDSGFFDFNNVTGTGPKPVIPNGEDSVKEPISMDSTENANAAMPSADEAEEEEADSDTHDKCAHKNCRRLRYEDINWVQCDDCDKWYHCLCILGTEKEFEEDEFHCGCTKNAKQKRGRTQHSGKQETV